MAMPCAKLSLWTRSNRTSFASLVALENSFGLDPRPTLSLFSEIRFQLRGRWLSERLPQHSKEQAGTAHANKIKGKKNINYKLKEGSELVRPLQKCPQYHKLDGVVTHRMWKKGQPELLLNDLSWTLFVSPVSCQTPLFFSKNPDQRENEMESSRHSSMCSFEFVVEMVTMVTPHRGVITTARFSQSLSWVNCFYFIIILHFYFRF